MSGSSANPLRHLNPHIVDLQVDYYYHLGLNSGMDVKKEFGDVKYVLLCGSPLRAQMIAEFAVEALNVPIPFGTKLTPIGKTERYSMFKVGPIISVSHGMGRPSLSILLHEVTKLLSAAGVADPLYVRIGTCGGLGVSAGSVVVSTGCVDAALRPYQEQIVLGNIIRRECSMDKQIADALVAAADDIEGVAALQGITMTTDDFYEGQGRVDGAICEYTIDDKFKFLQKAHEAGVRNIEMEVQYLAAFCNKLNIRCATICCVVVNRLETDQVKSTPQMLEDFQMNALKLIFSYIKKQEQNAKDAEIKEPATKKRRLSVDESEQDSHHFTVGTEPHTHLVR